MFIYNITSVFMGVMLSEVELKWVLCRMETCLNFIISIECNSLFSLFLSLFYRHWRASKKVLFFSIFLYSMFLQGRKNGFVGDKWSAFWLSCVWSRHSVFSRAGTEAQFFLFALNVCFSIKAKNSNFSCKNNENVQDSKRAR